MAAVMYWYIALLTFLVGATHARLVFPPGSDVGYIVSDDSETKFEETNGINDLDPVKDYAERLLKRREREAIDSVRSALLRTIQNTLTSGENNAMSQPEITVQGERRVVDVPEDLPENLKDNKHGVAMGIPHIKCDNGKINITVDWDNSPVNHTCFDPKNHRLPVQEELKSVYQCVNISKDYVPQHFCMDTEIKYNTSLPTYGPHRPLWPSFGEYTFVPPQRWLHSIEHGSVVMLYHPCAEPIVVQRLKSVVVNCFRKHVITPYTLLTVERPLALVAWGCSLEMATVDEEEVKSFIKKHALHGPEGHMAKDGNYKQNLIAKAEYPLGSNGTDRDICPMDHE